MHINTPKPFYSYTTTYNSPIGEIVISSDGKNLTGLWIKGQKYFAKNITNHKIIKKDSLPIFVLVKAWLSDYFNGINPELSFNILLSGSNFQKLVWEELLSIPYSKTISYGEIAKNISKKLNINSMSSQAVGGAVGRNPISIIVPCHRVVGKNGEITGYASGINNKIYLLDLEKKSSS